MQIKTFHHEAPAQDALARQWLFVFFWTLGSLILLTLCFLWVERTRLPAPQFSTNLSFNEKMRWARSRLATGQCDTLILGSSMALNSIDGAALANSGLLPAVNLGAWGLGVIANRQMLDLALGLCSPKLVVMPLYYGDFGGPSTFSDFNADMLRTYLHNSSGNDLAFYMRDISLFDMWRDYRKLARYRRAGEAAFTTLNFDSTGGVLLACQDFHRDQARWTGYKKAPVEPSAEAMAAFAQSTNYLRARGIDVVVAETPMREVAREALGEDLTQWRTHVAQITNAAGGRFVAASSPMSDQLFADFVHVNACGAQEWTRTLLAAMSTLAR